MWIPDQIYRKMPLLYAGGGLTTVLVLGSAAPGVLSALLLFAAAAITWRWRDKKRAPKGGSQAMPKPPTPKRQRRPGGLPHKALS
ncbi:MAG: hypothetical protein WA210_03125 [Burkholderiaceae bacterium]